MAVKMTVDADERYPDFSLIPVRTLEAELAYCLEHHKRWGWTEEVAINRAHEIFNRTAKHAVEFTEEEIARIEAANEEYDACQTLIAERRRG